jgi:archaellum component FlaC
VKQKSDNVIRGKFRLKENAFPSARDKLEEIMKDVEIIMKEYKQLSEEINLDLWKHGDK